MEHLTFTNIGEMNNNNTRSTIVKEIVSSDYEIMIHGLYNNYGDGDKKENFRFAQTLVFIQCIINSVFAKLCEYMM